MRIPDKILWANVVSLIAFYIINWQITSVLCKGLYIWEVKSWHIVNHMLILIVIPNLVMCYLFYLYYRRLRGSATNG